MLNELLIMERGAAGIETEQRHPDIKPAGKKPTLKIHLDEKGRVVAVAPVASAVVPWTLRDGQHNSFPFVQPRSPLWTPQVPGQLLEDVLDRKNKSRREGLLSLAGKAQLNDGEYDHWPGHAMIERLRRRQNELQSLTGTEASVVPATVDRFLLACGNPTRLISDLAKKVIASLQRIAQEDLLEVAVALFVGEKDKKNDEWRCAGALLFEASGYPLSIVDPSLVGYVSRALIGARPEPAAEPSGHVCGLTGRQGHLIVGNFPQPNLPVIGQTWLFAKNKDIPASERYGRSASDAMPVGEDVVIRLDAVLRALTEPNRKNKSWRAIPSDVAAGADLLVAFIRDAPDERSAEILVEEDFSDEEGGEAVDPVAKFEKRTERLVQTIRAKTIAELSPQMDLIVVRRVDPANRKVVYSGSATVAVLERSCRAWIEGERNVPPWLVLPVFSKVDRGSRAVSPPHVAPLGLIAFTKGLFIRNGTERQDAHGLSAAEALGIFLGHAGAGHDVATRRLTRALHLVVTRRKTLCTGAVHALRRSTTSRSTKHREVHDHREVLRTVTVLSVILHKLGRRKETYMNETAFQLGQLLAAADVVHAGYCADRRNGSVPPSLLGNQVFAMAQNAPARALAVLCRRWKPYDGWAKEAVRGPRVYELAATLIASKKKEEQQRGWDIRKAVRYAREIGPLAARLAPAIEDCHVNDVFSAELLLGYMAGLPKTERRDPGSVNDEQNEAQEE